MRVWKRAACEPASALAAGSLPWISSAWVYMWLRPARCDTRLARKVHFLCHNLHPMKREPSVSRCAPVRALLQHFHAQRPLRAGSLLISIFGDAIAPRGGAVTLGSLIRLAAPFGLAERAVRTSVARLARDGWLSAARVGRRSEYHLSASGAARFAEATQRIYAPTPAQWNRRWTLLLLPAGK